MYQKLLKQTRNLTITQNINNMFEILTLYEEMELTFMIEVQKNILQLKYEKILNITQDHVFSHLNETELVLNELMKYDHLFAMDLYKDMVYYYLQKDSLSPYNFIKHIFPGEILQQLKLYYTVSTGISIHRRDN